MVKRRRSNKGLVVFAHPVPGSFTHAIRDRALKGLEIGGMDVDTIDLYADGFDPTITAGELKGVAVRDKALTGYAKRVKRASMLVFVYPTWWGAQPAIVKGWLDRLLSSGEGAKSFRSVKRIVVVSPHGSTRLRNGLQGVPGRRILFRHLRSKCHRLTRCAWIAIYNNDQIDDSARAAFLDEVEAKVSEQAVKHLK